MHVHSVDRRHLSVSNNWLAESYSVNKVHGCRQMANKQDSRYLKFEGKHGHYFTKRNKKAEKNEENEGKDQVGGKGEQSAHHRDVPRGSTMSPNDPENDDDEGWCKTTMNYIKG
uniref:Uncharacterized protein n=1 Tax=Solanum tuberosum TaxID=4113 RepID=M1DN74_SOLTU